MRSEPIASVRQLGSLGLYSCSVLIGIAGAFGAVVFRGLIALFHNVFFLGQFSFIYDANIHTPPSPWGPFVVFVPVLGAAGVAFLVGNFAPEAKGHGVPEVMDAVYYNKGIIRPVVALIKSLASALSIGSGGSVGREGPIVQIGSSFASSMGQLLRVPLWQRVTLIAGGAGAGIAATFNTPIGGVLFAVEIMLHEVSARTLVPVTIATVTASYIGRLFFGSHPSFVIPTLETPYFRHTDPVLIVFYVLLGIMMGLVSLAYIRSVYTLEDFFEKRVPGNYYFRHMLGMLPVGIMMYTLLKTTGHYHVEGVGYATVQDILSGNVSSLLIVLFVLKLLATSLTLGSGALGGVFSPALYLGAALGGLYGSMLHRILPHFPVDPAAFAVAGMAGVVGGSTGAALAAIVMIFEMTLDYTVIIPITITVALSYGIRKILHPESIYSEKLARRGHAIPDALQANFYYLKKAHDIMDSRFVGIPGDTKLEDFGRIVWDHPDVSCFLVQGPQGFIGFLTRDLAIRRPDGSDRSKTVVDLADKTFVNVSEDASLIDAMTTMRSAGALIALVLNKASNENRREVRGLITKQMIANAVLDGMELYVS